jgi:DNA recombination protein RmuC
MVQVRYFTLTNLSISFDLIEVKMQISIGHIIFLIAGLSAGAVMIWLILKNGHTSLTEQFKSASEENERLKTRLTDTEGHIYELQTELEKAGRECAQLNERTKRMSEVEELQKEIFGAAELLKKDVANWREANGRLTSEVAAKQQRITEFEQALQLISANRDNLLREQAGLQVQIAELNTTIDKERTHAQEKLDLINEARKHLSNEFKALANEILDEKSKKFTEQNQTNLTQLLDPLQEKIKTFQAKVEEVYVNEGKDRSALAEQVKLLTQLNNTLSEDTQNLTLALKGDRKSQGNWGEIILDEVLENAGLRPGQHYERQGNVKSEDGQTHVIPDVVVHLPGDHHLVVDSKMTLPDYRIFASSDDEEERATALKRHLASIRSHIKGLSEKSYHSLYGIKSMDFVVMFVPLEPAFMVAVTNDRELFQQAWEKNVLLVSPSTLLFVVRTVAYLWRQEDLSRNARDISNRGAELYDKLCGFVTDLEKIGERIQQAQNSYDDARKKFCDGSGNVIRQAEMLKKLGVKPTKTLPPRWIEPALAEPPLSITSDLPEELSDRDK